MESLSPGVATVPRAGMFALVRNRRGVIAAVEPSDDARRGRLHLVHIEYKDDQLPVEERLLWELEPRGRLLEPNALPDVSGDAMPPDDFDALVRAARWTSASPFIDPDGQGPLDRLPISSPFHGAVQVKDFQLVPLLKALAMPRVNLLIADDALDESTGAVEQGDQAPVERRKHLPNHAVLLPLVGATFRKAAVHTFCKPTEPT